MMVTRKPVSWFLTETGRKFSFAVVTGSGMAFTAAKFFPHTILLDKYKEYVHYYSNGKPVDLTKDLQERYEKCLALLNVSDVHKKLISPFSVFGYDLFHAGSTSSKFGVAVGIPVNFTYKSVSDLENHDIRVNQEKIDWTSEYGQKLADAIILSENVQNFAICREILMTQNNKVFYESAYPFMCVFVMYNLTQYLNNRLNLYAAPKLVRGTLYGIIGLFGLGTYFLLKDMTEVHYETKVDKQLCELGPEFIESGVIFYEKLLQRNQALRELMGSEGQRKYSKLGNENFFLRQPRIALVHRKAFFEEKLKECRNEEGDEDN
ncbi:transmembrane protein 177 [Plodia interpunctella]|uniref:transmembrane protein 177 n=1 Tax=Plodia interpunctella TaxID=58824 RepID=UPI0023686819|nr:transmembrane protein 177 [Plodia interpunctella]